MKKERKEERKEGRKKGRKVEKRIAKVWKTRMMEKKKNGYSLAGSRGVIASLTPAS